MQADEREKRRAETNRSARALRTISKRKAEIVRCRRKYRVGVFTVCILLAILLSVMTTFVLTRESFVTRARTSDNSAENLAAKLTELDGRFNQHYIGETDYETAEKYVMSAYLAGTATNTPPTTPPKSTRR